MSIDNEDVIEGIEIMQQVASKFGPPGKAIGFGLELLKDAVIAASTLQKDSIEIIAMLKKHLQDTVTAELQKALDED